LCADLAGVSLFLDLGEDGAELGGSVLDGGDGHDDLGEVLSYGRWQEMGAGLGEPPRWTLEVASTSRGEASSPGVIVLV
jgi:hypothetical protein